MRGFIKLLPLFLLMACATGPTNKVRQKTVTLTGGVYERKAWDDSLNFSRTSWYLGASLSYDVWLVKLDKNSPFRFWMGNNKEDYANCREFYAGLFYSNTMSTQINVESVAAIKKQISDLGFEEVSLNNFKANISAHSVYQDWHLRNHRVAGFCYKKMSSIPSEIPITLPGFKTINAIVK